MLAHEYAHALMGHVAQTRKNSFMGELLGGARGAGGDRSAYGSTAAGAGIGLTVFSREMELEADDLAMFMLAEAGYDLDKGMQFFQRTYQIQHKMNLAGRGQAVGFFATHPSDEERLLRLLATKAQIEQGVDRPMWSP